MKLERSEGRGEWQTWRRSGAGFCRVLWAVVRRVDSIPGGIGGPRSDASDSCFRRVTLLLGEEGTAGIKHGDGDRDTNQEAAATAQVRDEGLGQGCGNRDGEKGSSSLIPNI